jgi:hypothetical protein
MVTLTRERVIDAAPIDSWRRAELYELLEIYPLSTDTVFCEAWEALIKWYRCECKEIGERRAFLGLVYRLVDDPTEKDIECIQGWVTLAGL